MRKAGFGKSRFPRESIRIVGFRPLFVSKRAISALPEVPRSPSIQGIGSQTFPARNGYFLQLKILNISKEISGITVAKFVDKFFVATEGKVITEGRNMKKTL